VPKNSEKCSKVCDLLLLVELLRLRRPGLSPVAPESLIRLVGLPRKRPTRADSQPALSLLKESLEAIPKKDRPTNQLDLFMDALVELNRLSSAPPPPAPESFDPFPAPRILPVRVPGDAPFPGPARFSAVDILNSFGLVALPTIDRFRGFNGGGEDLPVPTPGIRSSFSRTTAPSVCRLVASNVLPFALSGQPSPLTLSAAIAASLGCGVGISRGV